MSISIDAFNYIDTLKQLMRALDQRMDELERAIDSYSPTIESLIQSIQGRFADTIDDYELIYGSRLYNTARSRCSRHPLDEDLRRVRDTFKRARALRRQQLKKQQLMHSLLAEYDELQDKLDITKYLERNDLTNETNGQLFNEQDAADLWVHCLNKRYERHLKESGLSDLWVNCRSM